MKTIDLLCDAIKKTKATNVVKINISKISSIADYFVLATGSSSTNVNAIADQVEVELKKHKIVPLRRNGRSGTTWVILDYGDVVLHVFDEETRELYNLEKLWGSENNLTLIGEDIES